MRPVYIGRAADIWQATYDALPPDKQPKALKRQAARTLEIAQGLALDDYDGNPADLATDTEINEEDVLILRKPRHPA